ncbi:MAG: DUF885 family protein [Acidobacteriota bacterium]
MRISRFLFPALLPLLVSSCQPQPKPVDELHQLFDQAWDFQLKENPLFATSAGVHEYDDRLPSVGQKDQERRARYWREMLQRLGRIDRSRVGDADRISYDMFERQLSDRLAEFKFKSYLIPLTSEAGFHTSFARLPQRVPLKTARDYENYIARLRAFTGYANEQMDLMRTGIAEGFVLPRVVLEGYTSTISAHIVKEVKESVFYAPFQHFPSTIPVGRREGLRKVGSEAILEQVIPTYRRFLEFMTEEYIPHARPTLGASELPNGREYYAYLIRHHTTLDLSAQQVHQIGLEEIARIHEEMMDVIRQVGFKGDFEAFLNFLRSGKRFYARSPEQLLKEASWIAKRMDGKLPSLFKRLPRQPYGVAPVPESIAPRYTAGRYVGAPIDSTRAGTYWVNTYALESRPLYALQALTLHEAVPGHHLQNALRQELKGLPHFRRFSGINAYGEGWGLYCEWLGLEAGFYTDPYDNFGRLTYEMWRACRLVVDTGLHAMGWTRQQALDFLASNTALSLHEIGTETDRYISWPGQALAYKMGELKIRELRRQAEEALGGRFDVREFHDVILGNGPVPLTILEQLVKSYIEEALSGSAPAGG